MLTGRIPFPAPDRDERLRLHREASPPRPSSLRPGVPEAVDAIILRLLEKDPELFGFVEAL